MSSVGQAPSTVVQVALLVLFVLPGVTYQFLRERWRGPTPGERDLSERVLRAVAASVLLDAVYLVVAGPQLVRLARGVTSAPWDGLTAQPRVVGLVALVLFILIPAAAAAGVSWMQRRRLQASYRVRRRRGIMRSAIAHRVSSGPGSRTAAGPVAGTAPAPTRAPIRNRPSCSSNRRGNSTPMAVSTRK